MMWSAAILGIVTKVTPTIQAVNSTTSSRNQLVAIHSLAVLPTGRTIWATTATPIGNLDLRGQWSTRMKKRIGSRTTALQERKYLPFTQSHWWRLLLVAS